MDHQGSKHLLEQDSKFTRGRKHKLETLQMHCAIKSYQMHKEAERDKKE